MSGTTTITTGSSAVDALQQSLRNPIGQPYNSQQSGAGLSIGSARPFSQNPLTVEMAIPTSGNTATISGAPPGTWDDDIPRLAMSYGTGSNYNTTVEQALTHLREAFATQSGSQASIDLNFVINPLVQRINQLQAMIDNMDARIAVQERMYDEVLYNIETAQLAKES